MKMNKLNILGKELKEARLAKGMTQSEVARRLKVTVTSISNIETGRVDNGPTVIGYQKLVGIPVGSIKERVK